MALFLTNMAAITYYGKAGRTSTTQNLGKMYYELFFLVSKIKSLKILTNYIFSRVHFP